MLQVTPEIIEFEDKKATITIMNTSQKDFIVQLKSTNTTAYTYFRQEFTVPKGDKLSKEIVVDIPR